jgi:oligoribonuclease
MSDKYFLFLDTETTGLDPREDAILEVAWFLTNEHFEVISEPQTYAVNIDEGNTIASLSAMGQYVREMHTATGLLDELEDGATLDYIFQQLANDIDTYAGIDDTVHIAGFSIHFDVDFLKANDFDSLFRDFTPKRTPHIHHRHLDLSSVKLVMEATGMTNHIGYDSNDLPHRALNDAFEALYYAKRLKNVLGMVVPFEPVKAEAVNEDPWPEITIVEGSELL